MQQFYSLSAVRSLRCGAGKYNFAGAPHLQSNVLEQRPERNRSQSDVIRRQTQKEPGMRLAPSWLSTSSL